MQILRAKSGLKQAIADVRGGGNTLALVPTMGALHAGHLALIAEARRQADRVAATIFVNPLQFGANEDLSRYPRQEEHDAELLEQAGCDLLWLPTPADLYPDGFATSIEVRGVSERWDGASRPGHFAGVATVVAKLLIAVAPDVALFGEKDFQQLAVIRRLVADLVLPVTIVGVPTVRDEDGLALSSRNAYLSEDERRRALALPEALEGARQALLRGEEVGAVLGAAREAMARAGFGPIDYLALVDAQTLEPLDRLVRVDGEARLLVAAKLGSTRLIDNLAVGEIG